MILRLSSLLALSLTLISAILRAEEPSVSIRPSVILSVDTQPSFLYDFEASSTLSDWAVFSQEIGTGSQIEKAIPADIEAHSFFRVRTAEFPKLQDFDVLSGGRNMNPSEFDPDIYHFSFRQNNFTTQVRPMFDANSVASCTINGTSVASGGTYQFTTPEFLVTNLFHLDIILTGTNDLRTKYVCRVLPAGFFNLTAENLKGSEPGTAILTTMQGAARSYAALLDTNGVPYWWKPLNTIFNFKLHENGLLSHIQNFGPNEEGFPNVQNTVLDQYFNPLFSVGAQGKVTKNHQFILTRRGTALVLGQTNLVREVNGETVPIMDNVIQELSLPDKRVIWEFNSWGNVSYEHSYYPGQSNYSHLNWIWELPDGDLLASSRGMSQILKIDKETTNVVWRLGRMGDFQFIDDPKNGFAGQHCVTVLENGNILLFDNRNFVSSSETLPEDGPSRIVEYKLDEEAKTATLVWSYEREGYHNINQGGAIRLANGNTLIAWGNGTPHIITEVTASGEIVFDIAAQDDTGRLAGAYVAYKVRHEQIDGLAPQRDFGPQLR